jgi:hypothetical protein
MSPGDNRLQTAPKPEPQVKEPDSEPFSLYPANPNEKPFSLDGTALSKPYESKSAPYMKKIAALGELPPLMVSFLQKKESGNNTKKTFEGFNSAIDQGLSTEEVAKQTYEITAEDRKSPEEKRLADFYKRQGKIVPGEADSSGYKAASSAYQSLAGQAPTMPTRTVPAISENQRLLAALAVALGLGGEGQANIDLASTPEAAAQQRADDQYKQDMTAFGAANNTWENQMKASGAMMGSERQLFMDRQDTLDKRYASDARAAQAEEKQLELALNRATVNQQRALTNAVNDWQDILAQAWKDGELDEDERGELIRRRETHLKNYSLGKEFVASLAVPKSQKSEARIKAEEDRDLNYSKFYNFVINEGFKNELKTKTLKQQREMFDARLKQNESQFKRAFELKGSLFNWKQFVDQAKIAFEEERLDIGWAGVDTRNQAVDISKYKVVNDITSNLVQLNARAMTTTDPAMLKQINSQIEATKLNRDFLSQVLPKIEGYKGGVPRQGFNPKHMPLKVIPWLRVTERSKNDFINPSLARDMSVGNYVLTIGTAATGHDMLTNSQNPSRHIPGNAVDITHINGVHVKTPQGKKLADEYVKQMQRKGYTWNTENGNDMAILWQTEDHYDHIHISRKSDSINQQFFTTTKTPVKPPAKKTVTKKDESKDKGKDKDKSKETPAPGDFDFSSEVTGNVDGATYTIDGGF